MKNLLLILFFLPMVGFGQSSNCNNPNEESLIGLIITYAHDNQKRGRQIKLQANGRVLYSNFPGDFSEKEELIRNKWWFEDNTIFVNWDDGFGNNVTYKFPYDSSESSIWIKKRDGNFSNGTLNQIAFNYFQSSFPLSCLIKKYVEEKINAWQVKSEFEKITTYQKRVNENTRNEMIDLYLEESITYYKKITIDIDAITLQKYDSENETFLLKLSNTESFPLPVPINEAKSFKENFNPSLFINIDMVMKDNTFILSHIEYVKNENEYVYDISDNYSYATTTFDYNFDEIDIDIQESSSSNTIKTSNTSIRVGNSFVDSDIPKNKKVSNRYALVIGNEDYSSFQRTLNSEQNVDYAENDATIFKQYCLNTLGVKQENMHFLLNATAGQMSQVIDLTSKILSKLGDEAELIVYYAGHGYPDELTKVPYLIPVDVSATNLSSAIKLSDVYSKLSETNASKISIFLDACFTGGGRASGLVASRGVKVRPKEGSLSGNLVVFSASSGDQSSLPYHKEAHGMFTYHLLKKLQETQGNVSMGELSDYLDDNVSLRSLKENKKEQDPSVNISQEVIDDWRNWKF
jgi:hypothetical protein